MTYQYADLQTLIDERRRRAAAFYRVDLHLHTIGTDSSDYPSTHEKTGFVKQVPPDERGLRSTPNEFMSKFVQTAKDSGLRIVAVTDHNESDMAEQLSKLSDDELLILPGIEITAQTGVFKDSTVHILGIFPQGTSSKKIDKVFPPDCGMPDSGKRGPAASTRTPIDQLIRLIKSEDLNGLCIAAHVNSDKGLRTAFRMQDRKYLEARWLCNYLKRKAKAESLTSGEQKDLEQLEKHIQSLPNDLQNQYLAFLAQYEFDAIQIQSWEDEEHYRGDHTGALDLAPVVCLLSTDAHTLADIGRQGHCTYIKLSDVSLEGIKKAFNDPGARIRYDATVPTHRASRILGISFQGGSFDGQTLGFSDNLTTLIGGRGTGKSATIEALRYIFQQPLDDLPQRLRSDISDRMAFTLRDTDVKVLFVSSEGDTYVLKRQHGENRTAVFDLAGQPQPAIELPMSLAVRAEVYGWSEIETLSDSPRKQLRLLDRYLPDVAPLKLAVNERRNALQVNANDMVQLARDIKNLLPSVANAEEVSAELKKLDTPELKAAFDEFDKNGAANLALTQVLTAIDELGKRLDVDLSAQDQAINLTQDTISTFDNQSARLSSYEWWGAVEQSLRHDIQQVQNLYEQIASILIAMRQQVMKVQELLETEKQQIEATLNALAEKSGQKDFKAALSRRKTLSEKANNIKRYQEQIDSKYAELQRLAEVRRTETVPALAEARMALFKARAQKAGEIGAKLVALRASTKVKVDIIHLGDRKDYTRLLGHQEGTQTSGLFKGIDKQYLARDYPGYFSMRFTPNEFVTLLLGDSSEEKKLTVNFVRCTSGSDRGKIVKLVDGVITTESGFFVERNSARIEIGRWPADAHEVITMTDSTKVWNHISPWYYGNETHDYPDPDRLANILKLDQCDLEDRPQITLDRRPIEDLSPGQRCSALIPIVLVEGAVPLVIDQPEDNLDNKLVFDLVVDILRQLKERRQVILATHNPNIPVSGDAEQVIVFDSPSKDSCCAATYGSIDDNDVVRQIKSVMEGGDKAFEMRVKKYGFRPRTKL